MIINPIWSGVLKSLPHPGGGGGHYGPPYLKSLKMVEGGRNFAWLSGMVGIFKKSQNHFGDVIFSADVSTF